MPARRARRNLLSGGSILNDGSRVWRVGHVAGPLDFPPKVLLPDPRSGRFDDPLKKYRTLYCARFQTVALRETLQQFRRDTATLSKLRSFFGGAGLPPATVPDDWRLRHVLAPARIRLASGTDIAVYEGPGLLRDLEGDFAEVLHARGISRLDIPALRSRDRIVSQLFGRSLYDRGYAGVVFESALPPGGRCVALFEGRTWLEPAGVGRPLGESLPVLRSVCREFGLVLS